jgi:hypothetical protein
VALTPACSRDARAECPAVLVSDGVEVEVVGRTPVGTEICVDAKCQPVTQAGFNFFETSEPSVQVTIRRPGQTPSGVTGVALADYRVDGFACVSAQRAHVAVDLDRDQITTT